MNETIAAIATPEGHGGLSVIRISGPEAIRIVSTLFFSRHQSRLEKHPWRMTRGHIRNPLTGELLDEVLAVSFRAPRSFTGEDTVEFSCHGNPNITRSIMDAIIGAGARPAEPGEFTRRAFENGRIDMSQAEAIAQITACESDAARQSALSILTGGLSTPIRQLRSTITRLRTAFELDLDFPEENASVPESLVRSQFQDSIFILQNLMDSGDIGEQLRRCRRIVISGKVNAGKSSLFNQLTGRERAIVSDEPGTTRDIIEVPSDWQGCRLMLVDSAGIRQSPSSAEKEAVRRSIETLETADFVIYVIDGLEPDMELLETVLNLAMKARVIAFWNKADLIEPKQEHVDRIRNNERISGFFKGSARHGQGILELRQGVCALLTKHQPDFRSGEFLMMTLRQRSAIESSLKLVREADELFRCATGSECIIPMLRSVDHHLGLILGDTLMPDVLGEIFSGFCIGK